MNRKAKALQRKIDWNTAIAEGRVMRSQGGLSMCSFATRTDALAAVVRCNHAGMQADIIDPSLADKEYANMEQSPTPRFDAPRCEAEIRQRSVNVWSACGRAATLQSRREHRDCTYTLYFCAKHRKQAFGRRAVPGVRIISVKQYRDWRI